MAPHLVALTVYISLIFISKVSYRLYNERMLKR